MAIPKIIHRIWIQGSPSMPAAFTRNGLRWVQLNPEWQLRHWTLPDFQLANAGLYRHPIASDPHRCRADVLRLEILLRYGGLYVDMDIEPLRPIDELLQGHEAVAAWSPNRWKGERILSNAFLAAVPEHPWIVRCVEKMAVSVELYRGQFLAMVTGPHHVHRCLEPTDQVHLLEPAAVYPTSIAELADAYAFHAWANRAKLTREALV